MREKIFGRLARVILRSPRAILCCATLLTVGGVYLAMTHLPLHTDQDDLVSEDVGYHHRYKEYLREFGDQEYLYLVVETGSDRARAKQFVRHFVQRLEERGGATHFRDILYRIDNPAMERGFLLYLPPDQLKGLAAFFQGPATRPAVLAQWHDFTALFTGMNAQLAAPVKAADRTALTIGFQFLDHVLEGMAEALQGPVIPKPHLDAILFGMGQNQAHSAGEGDDATRAHAIDDEGYFLSADGRFLFVLIMPQKNYATLEVIAEPLREVRAALAAARVRVPGVTAGLTGRPVLQADEMIITHRDMTVGTIAALVAVTLLFTLYFRRPTRPLFAVGALAMGITWTYGFAALTIGYLNILSIVFAVILIGAGIEYGLQIVARYREELATHGDVRRAVTTCITHTGKGNLTACLTTAAAFFAALGTEFLALRELGLIAGVGIFCCLAAMLTVLPAAMYLHDRGRAPDQWHTTLTIRLDALARLYARPRLVLGLLGACTVIGLPGLWRLTFDHNLLNLQARGLESVEYEMKLATETDQSTWYTPFVVNTAEDAIALADRVRGLPTVKRVETIADIVPTDQPAKIATIARLAETFAGIRFVDSPKALSPAALVAQLKTFAGHVDHLAGQAFQSGEAEAVKALEALTETLHRITQSITDAPPQAAARLVAYQQVFFADFQRKLGLLASGMHPQKIALSNLPAPLTRRYVSPTGRHVFYAYPKENLWDPKAMQRYIHDIRTIDPNVTGVPVEVYESSQLLERSFHRVALVAFIAILCLACIDFRHLRHAALAVAPLIAGLLWLLEIMGWMGLPFNLANFFAIPILIGVGVDNGIQLMHRYRQERGLGAALITRSTGTAVLLTSATTFASFVMLCFATHRGIQGLGLLISIGTLTCLVGSMLLLPCLLQLNGDRHNYWNCACPHSRETL